MNGEIPSVPITTLAGIASLTDLLPEMPLPSPLPQTLSNKSLLFHPRVAEEAQRLLSTRDDALIPQLIHSIGQTSADHIELKDNYAGSEAPVEQQQNIPELLKAILQRNPGAFKGPLTTSPRQPHWSNNSQQSSQQAQIPNSNYNQASPASYGQPSPAGFSHSSYPSDPSPSSSRYTPQGSPSPAAARYPGPDLQGSPGQYHAQGSPYAAQSQTRYPLQNSSKYPPNKGYLNQNYHGNQLPGNMTPSGGVNQPTQAGTGSAHMNSASAVSPSVNSQQYQSNKNPHNQVSHRVSVIQDESDPQSQLPDSGKNQVQNNKDTSSYQNSHQQKPQTEVNSNSGDSAVSQIVTVKREPSASSVLQEPNTPSVSQSGSVSFQEKFLSFAKSGSSTSKGSVSSKGADNSKGKQSQVNGNSSTRSECRKETRSSESRTRTKQGISSTRASTQSNNTATVKQESKPAALKEKRTSSTSSLEMKMKEPRVMLNKLSEEDEKLMQRSLKAFAQKSPDKASKMGIVDRKVNHKIASPRSREAPKYKDSSTESESDEEPKKNRNKYFKAREKEREEKRRKDKEDKRKRPRPSSDDEYVPEQVGGYGMSLSERIKKRRRGCHGKPEDEDTVPGTVNEEPSFTVPKKKIRKIERKLVPVIEKLSVDELMESNTFQRFNRTVEMVFDGTEDVDLNADLDEDADVPPEVLIPKYQLQDLCSETAKLKSLSAMESIPPERLVHLLSILELNIRDGAKITPVADPDEDEEESKLWLELTMERVMRAVDASLTAMYIMTSPSMPKRIYLEDAIDRVVLYTKFQLHNTIYPSFDPVYRLSRNEDGYIVNPRKKRAHAKEVREKSIITLYNKLHELVGLLAELLQIQVLTDTTVLHISTLGVSPFFVENVSELQLSALKLVTTVFTKYDRHRRILLDDILASIARLPSSKRSLRIYRLNSEDNIQMLTALVLQLIQCVVTLPDWLANEEKENKDKVKEEPSENPYQISNVDRDVLIVGKYETAMRTAVNFLSVFLKKCGSKTEEIDYRPLFENFVQDLLATVNKPEWPAAELLLSLLGKLLVQNFSNKGIDMSLRVASLDYLGVVAARLRRDAVSSQMKREAIDEIVTEIKVEEERAAEESGVVDKKKKKPKEKSEDMDPEEERTQFLQRVLLDFLAVNAQGDKALYDSRHFYISQWYRDANSEITRQKLGEKLSPNKTQACRNRKSARKRKSRADESSEEADSEPSESEDEEQKEKKKIKDDKIHTQVLRLSEKRKAFLCKKIKPFADAVTIGNKTQVLQTHIDYKTAELISQYLAAKRPFSQSFDVYLKQILRVLMETSIAVRTKAMKCLTMVVEADPGVLARQDMQLGVNHSFLDHSTSVREAAVDLVGKFVLSQKDLVDKYYEMLAARILDTGVSVRKRVIKIMKDICLECPEFPKIPEMCVKMIRRVNDEEGIKKLVMEVFQNMWFTPAKERPQLDVTTMLRKVMNITDVVTACRDTGLDWFEHLLNILFKPKEENDSTKVNSEPPKVLLTACKQIVDCLVENVLRLEETSFSDGEEEGGGDGEHSERGSRGTSQRIVACLTTLYLFAKIRPQLLVDHAITLQPYLSLKCQTQRDYQIISNVARTLELVVPLIEHPSETFLAQLEEDSVKLILQHDKTVVASCVSCLGSVVNNVTRNYRLVGDCFRKYFGHLKDYKALHERDPENPKLEKYRPFFRRALFTVGLLIRHFDFGNEEVRCTLPTDTVEDVFDTFMYFMGQPNQDMQNFTLQAIGSLCIRHYEFMLGSTLKTLYHCFLTDDEAPLTLRTQVLFNIETYLQEEEIRMIKQDQEWTKLSKQENLKEMGDVTSGMASTVIQLYLKQILESFLHPNISVRHAALKVIQLILQQGLVHPVQIVPYLICMSTDVEQRVSHTADKQLQDIEKKYPGFIHMKALQGIRLSYKLQKIIQGDQLVRGFRIREGEPPSSLNGFLYSILRNTKQQRRAIALSILKQFDEQAKTILSQMLFLSDNMAYFPYQVQDEPLFIIHHIDIMISVTGSNLLQSFREALLPPEKHEKRINAETGKEEIMYDEEEDDDFDSLCSRMPEDTSIVQECITASQGCLLLLVLKQHLKDSFGISDAKISQYSPSESAKIYEKAVNRKSAGKFDPKATISRLKEGSPSTVVCDKAKHDLIQQYLVFKQLMLKIDPDDEDDDVDESGNPQKLKQSPAQGNPGETQGDVLANPDQTPVPNSNQSLSVPVTAQTQVQDDVSSQPPGTVNKTNTGKSGDHKEPPQKVPKLTIVPPKPPRDRETRDRESKHHHRAHKSHKSERHKKHKHKKKKRRINSDEEEDDSDNEDSDPDFV